MITINTEIKTGDCSKAVDLAAQALKRDIENTCLESGKKGVNIALLQDNISHVLLISEHTIKG